jgi:hypothetical protein
MSADGKSCDFDNAKIEYILNHHLFTEKFKSILYRKD